MTELNISNQTFRAFGKVLTLKPETIARRAAKRKIDKSVAKALRIARLKALVERDGAESIWADLLEEAS